MFSRPRDTSRTRWSGRGLVVAAVAAGALVAVGPSGAAMLASDDGQPPPGTSADRTTSFRLGDQPSDGKDGTGRTRFELGPQPVNPRPEPPGGPTQVAGPRERGSTGDGSDRSRKRQDRGGTSGADLPGGRRD